MVARSGGDKLRRALDDIARGLRRGASLRVGFLQGATYPDGKPVAMIAAIQEFGAPSRNIPSRPFFRTMIANDSGGWSATIIQQLKATSYDASLTLSRLGAVIKGQLQSSIVDGGWVPNAPSTVRKKGFQKPLIDSSHMLQSADYQVEEP